MSLRPQDPEERKRRIREARKRQQESVKRYQEKVKRETLAGERESKLSRSTRINPVSKDRNKVARKYERNFGDHADTIRHLPCASCQPELYAPDRPLPEPGPHRLSDPSHAIPRGMGGARGDKTVLFPQCRPHHEEYEGHGRKRNKMHRLSYGIDPLELAERLWARAQEAA